MTNLFILSRTWGYSDELGEFYTQTADSDYIHAICETFPEINLAMVVVNPSDFDFVKNYRRQVARQIQVSPLRQTVRGHWLEKLSAQLGNLATILREVRSASHVVVFMSSLSAVWTALLAKVFRKRLLVYSGNDWAIDTALKFHLAPAISRELAALVTDWLETVVLRLADVRLVNSPQLYEKCHLLSGRSERVRPVSHFHLTDAFMRDDTCQGDIVRIVYPAALIPRKNHTTLLHAVSRLSERGIAVELLLAGAGESERVRVDLSNLANELGIGSRLRLLGYVATKNEMKALLRSADIFVLPSLNEGFPRVVWEAMLQSLPCAISRIPNIVADIGHRDVALMFDPLDAEDMASTLHQIITNPELRRHLIRNSHEYAREVFAESWREQLTRILPKWV